MRNLLHLLAILFITSLPISCCHLDSCGCGDFEKQISIITKVSSTIGSFTDRQFIPIKSTRVDTAAINVHITDVGFETIALREKTWQFSLVQKALACDLVEPEPSQFLTEILITSAKNVYTQDITWEAGEHLNDLFMVADRNEESLTAFTLAQQDTVQLFGYIGNEFTLQLKEQPDSAIQQTFFLHFGFDNGDSLQIETDTLHIL